MTVGGGGTPASTLWWDGWTVSKNINEAEAEATFVAMMNAIDPAILKDEDIRKQAVWLIDGYTPTDAARGVFAAAQANTIPYPMLPMGLLHTALGAELSDFMQGKETAAQALADVEAAYIAAAKEKASCRKLKRFRKGLFPFLLTLPDTCYETFNLLLVLFTNRSCNAFIHCFSTCFSRTSIRSHTARSRTCHSRKLWAVRL